MNYKTKETIKGTLVAIAVSLLTLLVVVIATVGYIGFYDGHPECMVIRCVKVIR